ncbi:MULTISPECIES: hypothetical protein [unclassified Pseudoalteromonas]|uniref:hypothetical protein n=1 Tax=unclassified Pseudoalteromonas TaxID=194690 RepID=UPI001F1769D0|nr:MULTISPECIES: hypothetical protein [unclassified Pseudoalteromonas]MCF2829785.1 hypothetical protein [Pseudoalteromonas sp. OF5H-5]MCF2834442.1 hypothetical protein [Pseudoalteromonas sp. DL2-H6]MCF2927751.1 hypothetical protein [Pseudoalteromonas sp. DL2-H1]
MKYYIIALLCLAGVYLMIPTNVSGDAYILTQSRSTVPMPLIKVTAYDYDEFNEFLANQRHYATINCGVVPTQSDLMDLQIAMVRNPHKRKDYNKAKDLVNKCALETLLIDKIQLTPIASAITDKEGKFSMSVGRKDVVLLAKGSRDVFGNLEKYIWIKPVSLGFGFNYTADLDNTGIIEDRHISTVHL